MCSNFGSISELRTAVSSTALPIYYFWYVLLQSFERYARKTCAVLAFVLFASVLPAASSEESAPCDDAYKDL
jgi:hypothetical protein